MDLLEQLKLEINKKGIMNDKFAIARYIYIRTGQLFDYYALYTIFPSFIKDDFNKEVKDIRCIRDFNIVCYSWAKLYIDLLEEFGIDGRIVENNEHAKVKFSSGEYEITADLTKGFNDIFRIKFGFDTWNYNGFKNDGTRIGFSSKLLEVDKKINYYHGISGLEILSMLEKDVNDCSKTYEERIRNMFGICESFFDFHKTSNVAANAFIIYMLNNLSGYLFNDKGFHTFFYDLSNNKRIDVYGFEDIIYLYNPALENPFYEVSLDEVLLLKNDMKIIFDSKINELQLKRINKLK